MYVTIVLIVVVHCSRAGSVGGAEAGMEGGIAAHVREAHAATGEGAAVEAGVGEGGAAGAARSSSSLSSSSSGAAAVELLEDLADGVLLVAGERAAHVLAALEAVAHVEVPALPRVRGDRLDEEAEGGLAHARHLGHVHAVRVAAARRAELLLVGERGAPVVDEPPVRVGEPAVVARALAPELARRHGEAEAAGRLALPRALPPLGVGRARPPAERRVHLEGGRAVGDGAAAGAERGATRWRDAGARAVGVCLVGIGVLGGDGAGEGEEGATLPGAGVGVGHGLKLERGGGGIELV